MGHVGIKDADQGSKRAMILVFSACLQSLVVRTSASVDVEHISVGIWLADGLPYIRGLHKGGTTSEKGFGDPRQFTRQTWVEMAGSEINDIDFKHVHFPKGMFWSHLSDNAI